MIHLILNKDKKKSNGTQLEMSTNRWIWQFVVVRFLAERASQPCLLWLLPLRGLTI